MSVFNGSTAQDVLFQFHMLASICCHAIVMSRTCIAMPSEARMLKGRGMGRLRGSCGKKKSLAVSGLEQNWSPPQEEESAVTCSGIRRKDGGAVQCTRVQSVGVGAEELLCGCVVVLQRLPTSVSVCAASGEACLHCAIGATRASWGLGSRRPSCDQRDGEREGRKDRVPTFKPSRIWLIFRKGFASNPRESAEV